MEHGEYDLAITLLPLDEKMFACEPVVEEELVLAVPSSHPSLPTTMVENRKYPAVEANVLNGGQTGHAHRDTVHAAATTNLSQ